MSERVARLRIELQELEAKIWRRIDIPLSTTLEALHEAIQMTMGWTFSHLWEFDIDGRCYGDPSFREFDDEPPIYKAKGLRLGVVISRGVDRFVYTYDYGDTAGVRFRGPECSGDRLHFAGALFEFKIAATERRRQLRGDAKFGTRSCDSENVGRPRHSHAVCGMRRLTGVMNAAEDPILGQVEDRRPVILRSACDAHAVVAAPGPRRPPAG